MATDIRCHERHDFLAKDMGWKYLLCTSLQDVQKIRQKSSNFSNLKTILQCFEFDAQENKRMFSVF